MCARAKNCKHNSPRGSDQISVAAWRGCSSFLPGGKKKRRSSSSGSSKAGLRHILLTANAGKCNRSSFTVIVGPTELPKMVFFQFNQGIFLAPRQHANLSAPCFGCSDLRSCCFVFGRSLQTRHLFHICAALKALNSLITDIISKCLPLCRQMRESRVWGVGGGVVVGVGGKADVPSLAFLQWLSGGSVKMFCVSCYILSL